MTKTLTNLIDRLRPHVGRWRMYSELTRQVPDELNLLVEVYHLLLDDTKATGHELSDAASMYRQLFLQEKQKVAELRAQLTGQSSSSSDGSSDFSRL